MLIFCLLFTASSIGAMEWNEEHGYCDPSSNSDDDSCNQWNYSSRKTSNDTEQKKKPSSSLLIKTFNCLYDTCIKNCLKK